ncbi:hypothetical protein [Arthrobacter bambusae]|nr:hypothetical protein [Arthrobacter bambusae]MDQ0213151.1 hypothetical protein [Arthrobacter bambusae]MDQ0237399.1 hypothetical protein [Arthrobacter bambusae]
MSNSAQTTQAVIVIGGIDAHADTHHVVALDREDTRRPPFSRFITRIS